MANQTKEPTLKVEHYTGAAADLIHFLKTAFRQPLQEPDKDTGQSPPAPLDLGVLCISDVKDQLGRQCVDLVQEGGGVHGIALAGYTYVLESMGITFTKMAGTSAGAINTMLLHSTLSKPEVQLLQQHPNPNHPQHYEHTALDPAAYYTTRSEKMLENLAAKSISSFVDGHPAWRGLLLSLFKGAVKLEQVKEELGTWKKRLMTAAISLALFVLTALLLLLIPFEQHTVSAFKWFAIASLLVFTLAVAKLLTRARQGRLLWFLADRLGINPGNDFRDWIEELLVKNKIITVPSLREKLNMETVIFNPRYHPCPAQTSPEPPPLPVASTAQASTATIQDDTWFASQIAAAQLKIKQAQEVDNLQVKTMQVEAIWDRLIRLTKGLPAEDEPLMEQRIQYILPLFDAAIVLQDETCGYQAHTDEKPTSGPYTKELTLITTDITNEIKVEFPAMHRMYWGDDLSISPAEYVRASMAIPFFFTPLKVPNAQLAVRDAEWLEYMKLSKRHDATTETLLVDGGTLSNFPINIYATPEMPLPRKPTLGIRLEYEDETISKTTKDVLGEAGSIISTMRYFYDRDFLSKNDMYKRSVRSIDTGQIHWLNFALTEKDKLELFFRGVMAASLFLIHTHPELLTHPERGTWVATILNAGAAVNCSLKIDGSKPAVAGTGTALPGDQYYISIYTDGDTSSFKHEDLATINGRAPIHFNWQQYKKERLLSLPRLRYQRNKLKNFPA